VKRPRSRHRSATRSSQKTVWFPTGREHSDFDRYLFMLAQDVANSIVPIGGTSEKRSFEARLNPSTETVTELVVRGLSRDEGAWGGDLARETCEFFSRCALELMTFGETVYEIVFLSDETDGKNIAFEFIGVAPGTYTWKAGALVQTLPNDYAVDEGLPRETVVNAEMLLRFELPEVFKKDYPRLVAGLVSLGEKLFPDFAMPAEQERRPIPFDSTDYIRTLNMAIAQVVGTIGWDAGGMWREHTLEYFDLVRHLRFESFKVRLRDQMLSTVNRGISVAGKRLGFSTTLEIRGAPTVEEVALAGRRLESAECTFEEIFSSFNW
jgi:hypothetical protein